MSFIKKKLEEKFKEAYTGLNENQKNAVDAIDGPIMVIAGPGTGKTQILAVRVGKILLETDALPENILCLTYTDAGAVAMRKRLQEFIGAEAYKVNIHTFHSFCNDVIQENLYLFEKTALDPVSDLERIGFYKELIDAFPKNHPLKRFRGDVYFDRENLEKLFSNMKKEDWMPDFINERINERLENLKHDEKLIYKTKREGQWKKGDLMPKYYEEVARMEKLRAAVNEFDNFQNLMRKNNRYDFDDMIIWVIKAFKENKNLLADYQERYQYILVDEFQDTSGAQNQIVQLLISYWDKPNIFVVGDDDQSIYRFQGANMGNMLDFAKHYENELKTVVLTENYRSTQPILDVSKSVIENNEERLVKQIKGLSKDLKAANTNINQLKNYPEIIAYNSIVEERMDIVLKIEELIKNGVAPGKIAVIYRQNDYGEELARYFNLRNIPFYSKRNIDLLNDPFINKIKSILSYINAELDIPYGGDGLLFEILHYDFYKIPPIEIAKTAVEVNSMKRKKEGVSIRSLLSDQANAPAKDLFDQGMHPELKKAVIALEGLIAVAPNVTVQQLLTSVIQKAGILQYVLNHPQKIELMQYLTGFFDLVKEENRRKPLLELQGLMNLFDLMENEKIKLPLIKTIGNEKGVNLLTVHGSKGLEFEHVFLAGTFSKVWEKKKNNNRGFKIPDTQTISSSKPNEKDIEELRRGFYVALTRAEKYLHISYPKQDNEAKELEPSVFIAEIMDKHALHIENRALSEEQIFEFHTVLFLNQKPVIERTEEDLADRFVKDFVMNVTALNNYLKCPLSFYYNNLIRIPSGKNEATEFGSAVHFALQQLFAKMKANDGKFAPVETMIGDFNWYMQRHRENFTKESFSRRMEQGSVIIPAYYNKYFDVWNKAVVTEMNINVLVDGIPLKGKLDKLEFNGAEVNVVDYKTGNVDNAKNKLAGPTEKEPNGGDYWRQAVFYKLLVDNYDLKNWHAVSAEFDFIEPDSKKDFKKQKLVITPEDIEIVKSQIKDTWHKIQNKDFYTGCGKSDCHWCNFVKDNSLYVSLEEADEEE
jgi:DNA helicase-2/ATP-dependent DNA helicase PcrA